MNEVFEMSELCWVQDENGIHLEHHGIKGQKWGERRFQNEDGTLTEEGKRRYYESLTPEQKTMYDNLGEYGKRTLHKKVAEGKSFVEAHKDATATDTKVAVGILAAMPAIYAGTWLASYYGTKGLGKLAVKAMHSNTAERIRQRGAQFMKRYSAKKAGAITLGKKSYSIVNADPVKSIFGLIKR